MTISVLIVGYGNIGERHLRIVRDSNPSAKIYVLSRRLLAEPLSSANGVFQSLDEALGFSPDLAIVANPASFHLEYALALVEAGCHVLIEKPLSVDLVGIEALQALAEANGVVCQVGYNLRYQRSLREFRQLLHSGTVGRCLSVRCEAGQYLPNWRVGRDYRETVSARSALGGGVLLELSHEIDYLSWIFGDVEWVSAWIGRLGDLDIDVEDTAHLLMGFTGVSSCQLVGSLTLDFLRRDPTRIVTATGSEASLRWDGQSGTVELYEQGDDHWSEVYCGQDERDESYRAQWLDFLATINNKARPTVSLDDGVRALTIIAAAKQSAASENVRVELSGRK